MYFTYASQLLWIMGDSEACWLKDIDVTHQGHFLMHDSEELFLNTINNKKLIQFPWKYSKSTLKVDLVLTHLNCCLWGSFGSAQRLVEQLQTFSTTFRSLWKSTVIYWSPCDLFGNSSHDTRWKSHTFDSKKLACLVFEYGMRVTLKYHDCIFAYFNAVKLLLFLLSPAVFFGTKYMYCPFIDWGVFLHSGILATSSRLGWKWKHPVTNSR